MLKENLSDGVFLIPESKEQFNRGYTFLYSSEKNVYQFDEILQMADFVHFTIYFRPLF